MVNKIVGIRMGPVHSRNKVNHQNQFVPQVVLLRNGKVNIPPARPQPVPISKPKVFAPVPTGRQNRPFPFPNDRGYSPSVISGGQLLLSPQQVVLGNYIEKENPFPDAEEEGVFDSGCSKNFKLPDESMVVLRVPRKHNLYTNNLNNLCLRGNLACLVANALIDESVKLHRRMGHVNYKNMNRLVKGNLVRGLPLKLFKNHHTCVACCKGKQHKTSYKAINAVSSISEPLQFLHMDLFGPTSIRSIDHKYYCLVITDDYSRFCWVFFLEHKDESYPILKDFINLVENQLNKKVKPMRCDNVRTACYVLNRVLVTSPHNKTPYVLLTGNIPFVSHFKPFGCYVTILNTSDHLGKFDGKADEGYIVGYSASNKAYRVYNMPNKRVEEAMNLRYLKEKPNVGLGTQEATTNPAGTQDADSDSDCDEQVIIVPSYLSHSIQGTEPKDTSGDEVDDSPLTSADEIFQKELARLKGQEQRATSDAERLGLGFVNDAEELQKRASAKIVSPVQLTYFFDDEPTTRFPSPSDLRNHDPSHGIFSSSSYDDEFGAALNNIASTVDVSPVATKRINTIHPQSLIIGDHTSAVQTRSTVKKTTTAQALKDPSWVDAMQEEMQQFKFQNVWVLVDFPEGKYVIGTKWILKNKRDARGIVVQNKAILVAQGHRQEEGIDYDEVFALVARIEAIRLFLAFASYMGFMVYQMDVKSVFLYRRINEEAWCDEFDALMKGEFQISAMRELTFFLDLQVQQRPDGMFISQDKYVQEILNKFDLGSVRTATTPYEAPKPKSKHESDSPVNVHLYRSMIVKKIFKYLKGQPKLGLWYPRELPFVLEAYSDSDYVGANKDRKSTTGGC
uniref:Uncharacterized protein n=1 Tax=Tanacetum cinerariifolium TaxID=118510 RepID=A0A699IRK9_TANCI|nr:hypothetical protein [Tanacetum cinerariifolium]